jgi:ribonuclease G
MTRKRTRESLEQLLSSPCPHCAGIGRTKSAETVSYEVLREIQREAALHGDATRLLVKTSPAVATFLYDSESRMLDQLERTLAKKIIVKAQETFRQGQYQIVAQ